MFTVTGRPATSSLADEVARMVLLENEAAFAAAGGDDDEEEEKSKSKS